MDVIYYICMFYEDKGYGGAENMVNEVEFKKANNYSLKCMRVTFIVLVIAWILNVLHIFIVDQTIMNNAFFAGGNDFLCQFGTGLSCNPLYAFSYDDFNRLYGKKV